MADVVVELRSWANGDGRNGPRMLKAAGEIERLRSLVHHLETDCDPQGTIRENFRLREENKALRAECERLATRAS